MHSDNGFLTIESLMQWSETTVPTEAGKIAVRKISRTEYLSLLPMPPPESVGWSDAEWNAREVAWVRNLPLHLQKARRGEIRDVIYEVVALAAVRPSLTLEQSRRLANEATVVAEAVLRFSGLLEAKAPAEPGEQEDEDTPDEPEEEEDTKAPAEDVRAA